MINIAACNFELYYLRNNLNRINENLIKATQPLKSLEILVE
jgi:hypothetical protein